DIEHDVEILPAQGNLLAIWFVDHEEERPSFEKMLQSVNATGVEIWRINLLEDYFLPRSSENARTMPGDGVAVIIKAAHSRSNKKILLVAYDRMPLPLLRGVRQWQTEYRGQSRIAGAILFYPNMFGPSPIAGMDPVPDPILSATNIPVTVYQPMLGSHRWRTVEIMNALWEGGSPAILYLAPNIRDWFFMHPPEQDPAERAAT
ncbi:MAG: hypothetical protein GY731_14275, partial [Gammaproteobacteria bacterium]|nr:hypothetical protein [Gammaproteobacteria bacterium]